MRHACCTSHDAAPPPAMQGGWVLHCASLAALPSHPGLPGSSHRARATQGHPRRQRGRQRCADAWRKAGEEGESSGGRACDGGAVGRHGRLLLAGARLAERLACWEAAAGAARTLV